MKKLMLVMTVLLMNFQLTAQEKRYLVFEFMKVDNNQEAAYGETEEFWAKIHEQRVKIMSETCDCVWRQEEIKAITLRFEGTQYIFLSLYDSQTAYYAYNQPENQTLADYLTHFKSLVNVLDH